MWPQYQVQGIWNFLRFTRYFPNTHYLLLQFSRSVYKIIVLLMYPYGGSHLQFWNFCNCKVVLIKGRSSPSSTQWEIFRLKFLRVLWQKLQIAIRGLFWRFTKPQPCLVLENEIVKKKKNASNSKKMLNLRKF